MSPLILFCDGQSNAIGRNTDGPKAISPLVTVWNNRNDRGDLAYLGDAFVPVDFSQPPFVNNCNNMFVHLAHAIAEETGREVRMILNAKGNESIGSWFASSARQFMYLRGQAVLAAASVSKVDVWARHQGEADSTADTNFFLARYQALHQCMLADGYIGFDTPYLCGGLAPKYPKSDATLARIGTLSPFHQYIQMSQLPLNGDTHFTGSSLAVAGGLMFSALEQIDLRRELMGMHKIVQPEPEE